MTSYNNFEIVDHRKTKNLVRSRYYDVMVKVDTDVYYLDKLQLAWKSVYFEKLLIEYSDQKECSLIQLTVMDSDTFSAVADIIYGKTLTSVLNHDNYIALLMAMDYLQMEIDMETYASFIEENSVLDVEIFELYNFMKENPNLQCLLPSVLKHLSSHLSNMRNNADFLRLPLDDIIRIIVRETYSSVDKDTREICRICAGWIHQDVKSRLPHLAKLVNAVKRRFRYLNEMKEEEFNFNTVLSDITEQSNLEMTTRFFYKFLTFNGEINSAPQKLLNDEKKEFPIISEENERKKLTKLLENGHFHNIVVSVGEKTYKFHRFKLCSASGHFAEISSTKQCNADALSAESPTQRPITFENYVLLGVDQTTCDMIFKYIYFDELQLTSETITRVFRAASTFKMGKLLTECVWWTRENIEEVCAKILMIDECISRSWMKENIEEIFTRFLNKPETDNTLPICFISFDMLEDLLMSSTHCCNNPHRIKYVCMKWVFHDVKNRYHLIPRIALAINHNRTAKYNDFKIEAPADLRKCSEQMIRYELWNTLNSTLLIHVVKKIPKNGKKKLTEIPAFIAWIGQTSTILVLNVKLDPIASLCLSNSNRLGNYFDTYFVNITATLMDDNLFIMFCLDYNYPVCFYAYNLSSKKFTSLNSCVTVKEGWSHKFCLLNCRGRIYCCFNRGHVLQYSIELNRWMLFSKQPIFSDENITDKDVWFTSDTRVDKLYRLYASSFSEQQYSSDLVYVVDEFDFQRHVWLRLPYMSFTQRPFEIQDLTIIGTQLTVVFDSCFKSFNPSSRTWRQSPLTDNVPMQIYLKSFALVQFEDRLLHVFANKLYHRFQNSIWELRKELPFEFDPSENPGLYACIRAVHRHNDRAKRSFML